MFGCINASMRSASAPGRPGSGWQRLAGLMEAVAEVGLEGRCYRLRLRDLRRLSPATPGIAHVGGDHFVVVWVDNDGSVTVIGPPQSIRRMTPREFGRHWNGAILVVSRPGAQPWRRTSPWWWVLLALGSGLLFGAGLPARRARPRPVVAD